jgi:hypothetical protein
VRTLVLLAADHYVRNFVTTGAFDALDPAETFYVASERGVAHSESRQRLEQLPGWLGTVDDPRPEAARVYPYLHNVLLASLRRRSRTVRAKFALFPPRDRLGYAVAALPGMRSLVTRLLLWRAGRSSELAELMRRVRPDVVVAPSGGLDPMVWDGVRAAREQGITSLVLVHNWDNLSSKGAFAVGRTTSPSGARRAPNTHAASTASRRARSRSPGRRRSTTTSATSPARPARRSRSATRSSRAASRRSTS